MVTVAWVFRRRAVSASVQRVRMQTDGDGDGCAVLIMSDVVGAAAWTWDAIYWALGG